MLENILLGMCAAGLANSGVKFEYNCGTIYIKIPDSKDTYCISCTKCESDETQRKEK